MNIKLSDVLVSIIVFLLLASGSVLIAQQAGEQELRHRCADNLRNLAQGLMIYSNENRGQYPRTFAPPLGHDEKDQAKLNPTPTWGTPYERNPALGPAPEANPFGNVAPPAPNDVTAALFLLLRTVKTTSDTFVCPSTGRRAWDYGGGQNAAQHWTNWKGHAGIRDHLGYSYQNPYPSSAARAVGFALGNTTSAQFAVAADMNRGAEELIKMTPDSPMSTLRAVNSLNHGGDGQNVAFGDSHVEWLKTPLVGWDGDNIYTFGRDGRRPRGTERKMEKEPANGIVGSPVDEKDSILLPTARGIGLLDEKSELAAAAKRSVDMPGYDAITEKLVGKYTLSRNNTTLDLTITPTHLLRTGLTMGQYEVKRVEGETIHVQIGEGGADGKLTTLVLSPEGLVVKNHREFSGTWTRKP
jgi:hypothetical protein